ncbi:MAG: DUF4340 domain-containing protein [Saprospiraceae bacterium]|nr:DUF4340 domain-containing protein [Saprospiraceae bacterium]
MKKLIGLILVLLLFSGIAYYLVQKDSAADKGMVTADRGFTVKTMEDVDKIVIKHVKLQPLIFTKEGKGWILNGKYEVDSDVFVNVEKVLTDMTLSYIPPKNATANILKSIKNNGIQVDLYKNSDRPFKIFHIGSDTQNGEGTYMIMGGSSQPYVMQLPGLKGGLRSRFEQPMKNFRTKRLFHLQPSDIVSLKMEYPKDNFASFEISNGKTPQLRPLVDTPDNPSSPPNEKMVAGYLMKYNNVYSEGLVADIPERDSILTLTPDIILSIKRKDGNESIHKFFNYEHILLGENQPISHQDILQGNRYFVYDVMNDDMYTAQMRVIRHLFFSYKDFFRLSASE